MKSVTVRDLRNHFAKISAWLDQGEEVMITKRGRSYARIVRIEHEKPSVKIDFQQRLKVIYGEKLLKNPADLLHLAVAAALGASRFRTFDKRQARLAKTLGYD
jgi:antitoxin (DNA-binding transcriptional repressor) of toxin-antitoxin stability system